MQGVARDAARTVGDARKLLLGAVRKVQTEYFKTIEAIKTGTDDWESF